MAAQAGIYAAQSVKEISLKHWLRWAKLRPSDASTQPAPEPFTPRPVKQFRPAALGASSRSAPKIGHRRSQNRAKRTSQSRLTACQSADLRVCVELRGFESLTPSMRTEYTDRRSRCPRTFLHVSGA